MLEHGDKTSVLLPSAFVRQVEDKFCHLFKKFNQESSTTSAAIHLETLRGFSCIWPLIVDSEVCLVCLHDPDYYLPCKHWTCEACVQRYWDACEYPTVFKSNTCILCRSIFPKQMMVKTRELSGGFQVLSLDGGGCSGILKVLEDRIGLPYPIQEDFGPTVATSGDYDRLMYV
jgi:hypothetical protein